MRRRNFAWAIFVLVGWSGDDGEETWKSIAADGGDHLDLDGGVPGQCCHTDRRSRVTAGLTEHFHHQLADGVDDRWLMEEAGSTRYETGDAQDACNPIDRPQRFGK